ncbi:KRI1-like family C-terminal-domain-containing protein [Cercophora scortea]|uniref:KRI1-like family C-terminal-domain-containing protein n=1 Tax=Cercophora scortea TaxID=314031 RepID=A0AAE0IX28_9PEZI|nr:KRI1-like family C-terminal-domain-containing protein [Cercophora scortea]
MPRKSKKSAPKSDEVISKKPIFDDESAASSEDDQEDGGAAIGGPSAKLKINEDFARKFEHNKKREELHKLEEKYKGKDDDSESSSDDEDEDDEAFLVTDQLDAEISATLAAIKNKDPRIYSKEAVFYTPLDPEAEAEASKDSEPKEKPVFLRDYHRERYLAGDVGADVDDAPDAEAPRTYTREQADLKKAIISEINAAAAAGDEEEWSDDDAFIKPVEKKEAAKPASNGIHPSRAAAIKLTEVDVKNADNDPEEFLSKFMASKAWAPPEGSKWAAFDSDEGDDDDDLADEFEHAYNMRFEDPSKSNEVLKTYSRNAAAARSVRKEEPKGRKRLRMLEKEMKEAEEKKREEERARLRNLKVSEASDRLAKIKQAAGLSGKALKDEEWTKFLDDAWDDDKWEEEMQKRFGDDYYAQGDDDLHKSDLEDNDDDEDDDEEDEDVEETTASKKKPKKPKWDDDIDINDIIPEFDDESAPKISIEGDDEDEEMADGAAAEEGSDGSDDEQPASKKRKTTSKDLKNEAKKERIAAKRAARQEMAKIEALVNVKMELDEPRALTGKSKKSTGGFRYRETSPNVFGMTPRDILLAPSDAALNEFAGLKKLATFRDAEKKRKDKKRLGKKARLRQWRRETFGREYERTGPTFGFTGEKVDLPETPASGDNTVGAASDAPVRDLPVAVEKVVEEKADAVDGVVDGERKKKRKRSKNKGKKTAEVEA